MLAALPAAGWALLMLVGIATYDDPAPAWAWITMFLGIGIAAACVYGFIRTASAGTRPCPRCAIDVKKGLVTCPNCGFDFGTLVPQQPSAQ